MISLAIEVLGQVSQEPQRHVVGLPATIGRGHDCTIRLDADNRLISRQHVELVRDGGAACLVNRASNPSTTWLDGQALGPGQRVRLPPDRPVICRIAGIELRLQPAGRLTLLRRDGGTAHHELTPTDILTLSAEADAEIRRIAFDDWAEPAADDAPMVAFFLDHGRPAVAQFGTPTPAMTIDGAALRGRTAYLRPDETVRFAAVGIALCEAGRPARPCPDPVCGTLNAPERTVCRVCGASLPAVDVPPAAGP